MLRNYFKISLRNIYKHRLVSAINIIGLSLGIACAGFSYVFIQFELSFDNFHRNIDNIYYITSTVNDAIQIPAVPLPLVGQMKDDLPGVVEVLRYEEQQIITKTGNNVFEEKALVVDTNFFEFFTFPIQSKNDKKLFAKLNNVVISEEMADKYFGRSDVLGHTLSIFHDGTEEPFEISAVMAKVPANSSFQPDFLISNSFYYRNKPERLTDWHSLPTTGFFKLRSHADLGEATRLLADYSSNKYNERSKFDFTIHGFKNYRVGEGLSLPALQSRVARKSLFIFGLIGLIVLLMACLNFINLSNALGSQRHNEIGVRQILGAKNIQLMKQYLVESVLLSLISLFIAIILLDQALNLAPVFVGHAIDADLLSLRLLVPMVLIAVVTGLAAGVYPGFLMSKLRPFQVFKSTHRYGGDNMITRGSLAFQFIVSIGLLCGTITMYQQQQFLLSKDLGFDQDEVIVVPTHIDHNKLAEAEQKFQRYCQEVKNIPGILGTAGVSNSFGRGNRAQFIKEEDGSFSTVYEYRIDPNYLDLLDIPLEHGRALHADSERDRHNRIIVNRAFIDKYGIDQIDGYVLPEKFGAFAGNTIAGVTANFHFNHLRVEVFPMMMHMRPNVGFQHILLKINTEDLQHSLDGLKKTWRELNPEKPFEFFFLSDDIQKQYLAEAQWVSITRISTGMAILIAIIGLFGLISLLLNERVREISIRKILGSNFFGLLYLFSKRFIAIILVAALIAIPSAWYIINSWLENFAFRIDVSWWVFAASFTTVLLIALSTIAYQTMRTSMVDPAKVLRAD